MNLCPCGSKKKYAECCEKYISGSEKPKTAELLMRSRYTAFTLVNVDYIYDTHDTDTHENVSKEEIKNWAETSEWFGLTILNTEAGNETDEEGIVEFNVEYRQRGLNHLHHEKSKFVKKDGVWFYYDALPTDKTIVKDKKIGRNDPCPCGSGKKYKKCCGK